MSDPLSAEVVLVYVRAAGPTAQAGIALASPRTETILGDSFLVGEVPTHERDWASGLTAAVRLADVQHALFFESMADYQQRIVQAPAAWEIPDSDTHH